MRLKLTFSFLWLCSLLSSQTVTLSDLVIKFPNSKEKWKGKELQHLHDPIRMMVQAEYFYKGKLYTGDLIDSVYSIIHGSFDDGKVTRFSWDSRTNHYYRFAVTSSEIYLWHAVDSSSSDGFLTSRSKYFVDSSGNYRCEVRRMWKGGSETRRLLISKRRGRKIVFTDPIFDGIHEQCSNQFGCEYREYHNDIQSGLIERRDSSNRILHRSFYNPFSGYYGEYLNVDAKSNSEFRGQYIQDQQSGVWTTHERSTGILISKSWYNNSGNLDSSKTWFPNGNLQAVQYRYSYSTAKYPDAIFIINYDKTWYPNGQLESYTNHSTSGVVLEDTMYVHYYENGIISEMKSHVGAKIQTKNWNENGSIQSENYKKQYRDSVWRMWSPEGELLVEKYYDNGIFLYATVDKDKKEDESMYPSKFRQAAIITNVQYSLMNTQEWDTSIFVPDAIVDSVSTNIARLWNYTGQRNEKWSSVPEIIDTS